MEQSWLLLEEYASLVAPKGNNREIPLDVGLAHFGFTVTTSTFVIYSFDSFVVTEEKIFPTSSFKATILSIWYPFLGCPIHIPTGTAPMDSVLVELADQLVVKYAKWVRRASNWTDSMSLAVCSEHTSPILVIYVYHKLRAIA